MTPGLYVTRTGRYEVDREGNVWLIGGADLPDGQERRRVRELPADAVLTPAAMRAGSGGGTTPPGKAPDPEQMYGDGAD